MKEYRDHYFLKAKQENYPARSVYKLKEIDGRFKIFMGPDVGELLKGMRPRFARVTSFKPQSSRVESKETFFVGLGFKGKEADGARD